MGRSIASEPRLRVVGIEEEIPYRCIVHLNDSMTGLDWAYEGLAIQGLKGLRSRTFWEKRRRPRSENVGSFWINVVFRDASNIRARHGKTSNESL